MNRKPGLLLVALMLPVLAACVPLPEPTYEMPCGSLLPACSVQPPDTLTIATVESFSPWTGTVVGPVEVTAVDDLAELGNILDMPASDPPQCDDAASITIEFTYLDGRSGEEWTLDCGAEGRDGALADWGTEMIEQYAATP